ncbi:structure-specific endonuclease subunit SLX4 isoform X1 [Nothobranchius furzeri]|uniref:structure-specific endonuclease subunit SLX4 isoform X1 n=1 Tax=Nothobranchius furzeri TaxID=105023 RepID=UPI00077D1A4F
MDDSEQDFVDLCSKLLKRVRKKAGEPSTQKIPGQSSSQKVQEYKKQRNDKQGGDSESRFAASQPVGAGCDLDVVCGRTGCGSGNPEPPADGDLRTKDKVLLRMQHFKRVTPQKMVRTNVKIQQMNQDSWTLTSQHQRQDPLESFSSGHHAEGDEGVAVRLQQQLDREAAKAQMVDLEDGGLFFCQICHRDLSHMTHEGRTQHLNRCLDNSEESGPAPPPPSAVPDCPICGKRFKSQKSRSAHLKSCSSDMGVSPAMLLQILQRQAQESQSAASANLPTQPAANKRKGPPKSGVPARKKARKKDELLDEETMVALALSASMVKEKMETALPHSSMTPVLKWRPDAAKPCRKKKKDTVPRPLPLLLVQDAETALSRLQERVSALLLPSRPPSPATPTRSPSTLPSLEGAAPFWQRSALLDGDSCLSGFYSTELKHFFTSGESTDAAPSSPNKQPDSSVQPVRDGAPDSRPRVSILPHRSQNPSCSSTPSTPGTEQLPVGSQALQDLIDLAEDGMTLTQYGYTTKETRLSGFVQAESEELGASGFVLETTHQRSDETSDRAERMVAPPGAEERNSRKAVALSKLALDLSSMVNNPQMSDVQLQVDTGEVYFAHSFMVYARCPLLAEMVHESGIGVQEEGLPAAQRVLLNDVQGEAVLALLQYLYTSHCSISASLQPHMLELASRFDLQELEQLCRLQQDNSEAPDSTQQENVNNQTDQAFMEVLRSMWNEDDHVMDSDGGGEGGRMEEESDELTSGYREGHEEQVNEEELEEIYEFAATQRQKEVEATEEEEEVGGDVVFTKQLVEEEISDEDLNPNIRPEPESGDYESRSSSASKLKMISSKNKHESPPRASSKRSARTSLQSSASLVEDLLGSPSPVMSNLPVAGHSPGQTRYQDEESQPPCGVCTPLSPESSLKKEEPELIVLSDSSEEVDVADFVPQSLSDRSPSTQNPEDYTGIKAQTSSGADVENKEPRSVELNPDDPPDCSPELSWLIPSTPLQSSRSKRSSSTQTRSSMCRTQLFPKRDSSSSSGSPSKIEPHTSSDPQKAPHPAGTTKSRVTRPLSSSSLDHKLSPSKERGVNALQLELLRLQRLTCHALDPSKRNPLHLLNLPYSSTPVHQLPVPPAASPLTSDAEKRTSSSPKRDRTPLGSPEEVELRSFHLSPLSNPSDPSSSSHRSKRRSSSSDVTRDRLKGTGQKDEEEVKADMECTKERTGGTGVGESSLQQSLLVMDEPPIAFNDSWGLDACAEVNPGNFSLRLEDSKGLSPQEMSKPSYDDGIQTTSNCGGPTVLSHQSPHPEPSSSKPKHTGFSSPPHPKTHTSPEIDAGLLESKLWDSWNQEEVEECPPTQLRTPAPPQDKTPHPMEPITPMPHFSDMDTPELKNKLNRFGVRPLPKRQMILKLKQIHQYTHQVTSSDSEDEAPPPRRSISTNQMEQFKEPRAPAATSPGKDKCGDGELLSASQGSNTSSTATSEESERSNPEQVLSSDGDSDSDGGISSSQAASRLQDRIQAVRSFILSTPKIFNQILQYEPLVLSQFQAELKAAGIRLGAAKLMDYLDSQCITFTTAKLGQPGTSRGGRGGKRMGKGAGGAGRKKNGAVKL